jgi:hypothetical protein
MGKAGCWWLMPVILATWEAEIVRIAKSNLGSEFSRTPSQPKLGLVATACHPKLLGRLRFGGL